MRMLISHYFIQIYQRKHGKSTKKENNFILIPKMQDRHIGREINKVKE